MLSSFNIGYGDKEVYWIAATLAQEDFTFEPFYAGQYGDCFGRVMHFEPAMESTNEPDGTDYDVLYVNGEFMIELISNPNKQLELRSVGDYLSETITAARRVVSPVPLDALGSMHGTFSKSVLEKDCTCRLQRCLATPAKINSVLLFTQWVTFAFHLYSTHDDAHIGKYHCIPVELKVLEQLNTIFSTTVDRDDCHIIGCPVLPITVNNSFDAITYCVPITFKRGHHYSDEFSAFSQSARNSVTSYIIRQQLKEDQLIQCDMEKQIYVYQSHALRPIPGLAVFVSWGWDFSDVTRISKKRCMELPIGPELQARPA